MALLDPNSKGTVLSLPLAGVSVCSTYQDFELICHVAFLSNTNKTIFSFFLSMFYKILLLVRLGIHKSKSPLLQYQS